ncbi:MAG: hypothetical protein C4527_22200 [Candidatus Omnitrophota bacterium]|jgi:hypothetical protein|nr:MAG: hypothetical protein C4527_22200 [Candidatus Omnitrophota bacterium]
MSADVDNIIIPGRLPPPEICFINAILDDHEGMVVVRTEAAEEGRMEYWVAPDLVDEFMIFVSYVNEVLQIPMEIGDPIPQSTEISGLYKT